MAKQMVKERQDITGLNCIIGASGKVIVDDKGIKDSWKEYMEKLMNEENEWDHKLSAEVKERPADCIRMDEVRAALKEMKRHKAPGNDRSTGVKRQLSQFSLIGDVRHHKGG